MHEHPTSKPLSLALQFLVSGRKAMPATLGDRVRIAALGDLMDLAIKCRMRFESGDADRLLRLAEHTCVGVFRPLDQNFYSAACREGGTYPRLWERHHGIDPWMMPDVVDDRGEVIGGGRIAPGIPVLIGGVDPYPELPRIGDVQVWHCTSLSVDPDQIVICRYALPADRRWPFDTQGKIARRKVATRGVWKTLFPAAQAPTEGQEAAHA